MVESSRRLAEVAILLLASGCGESRSPADTIGGEGGFGGVAGEPSRGGRGGTLSSGAGGVSPTGGTSDTAGSAGAPPQGGASAQAGALGDAGEAWGGGVTRGGAAGGPSVEPGDEGEPVTVIRGDPEASFADLKIRGVALDRHEGEFVTVKIGMPERPPERLGSGRARIREGTFELSFPGVWEDGLYKQKLVHIDVDGDGTCTAVRDRLFQDSRGANTPELIVRGAGERGQNDIAEAESLSEAESLCNIVNAGWPAE
jgi:hypothetical protein